MTKVRVQDATKGLSQGVEKLLVDVSDSRKKALDLFKTLRKQSDELQRKAKEQQELQEREARPPRYEQAASFMNAYSTEDVPVPLAELPKSEPVKEAPATAEPAKEVDSHVEKQDLAEKSEAKPQPTAAPLPSQQEQRPQPARPQFQQGQGAPAQRPQQGGGQFGRPVQQGGPYGRPVQGAQQGQGGPYGRPVQGGQGGGQYGRPVQGTQGGQFNRPAQGGPYGRPVQGGQQGQGGPYGRPVQGGQGGPYGRPVQGAQGAPGGGQFGRPAPGGAPRPPMGGGRPPMGGGPGGRPPMGGPRPGGAGGAGGGRGGFGGRNKGPDLTPVMEKERVSNYDPNKKQYTRQNDPERNKAKARQMGGGRGGMYGMDDDFMRGKRKKKGMQNAYKPEPIKIEKAYMTAERITVKDLTERIGKPAGEIIKKLLLLGIIATINMELEYDTAQLVSGEFGVELELKLDKTAEDSLLEEDIEDQEEDLCSRAPIVTIMGHVDHGKTSLLDYIRNTRVTAGEAGGITQHIGAYTVEVESQKITFLDTPGHEAFTSMRARGAQVTDIAILVVAADDGVMPQTIEAINHAKAANVTTIIAINKIDKAGANVEKIKQSLTEYGLVSEDWGGDTIMVPLSAKTGENVDKLLEMILLVSELQNYRANPNRKARGVIIEAKLDKGRGPVATVLIKNGTLCVGDTVVAGTAYGRVRAMVNDRGERVKEAGPSEPVEVIGFNDVPDAGDIMSAVDDDKLSRQVAEERKDRLRVALIKTQQKTSLDDLFSQISAGQVKDLNLIVKADVQGSAEAVKQSLERLSNEEVRVKCIHGGVGAVTESDVMLASASSAIIIGFNVRYDGMVQTVAEREKVDIRLYRVIYDAIEEVQAAMKGMLEPKFKEVILGRAIVRQVFRVTGVGTIAGSYVTDGKILRNAQVRLLRDNIVVHEGKIDSLKRFKDDAKEVATNYECGIGIENYNDIKENDIIECFQMEEIER